MCTPQDSTRSSEFNFIKFNDSLGRQTLKIQDRARSTHHLLQDFLFSREDLRGWRKEFYFLCLPCVKINTVFVVPLNSDVCEYRIYWLSEINLRPQASFLRDPFVKNHTQKSA